LPPGEGQTVDHVHAIRLAAAAMVPRQQEALQIASRAADAMERAFSGAPGIIKPNLQFLRRLLEAVAAVLDDTVSAGTAPSVATAADKSVAGSAIFQATGPVTNREDAVRKLVEVADYFRRHEPSSPMPLLIDRVRRLAGLNFLALVEELGLGDQAVQEFRKLAGVRDTTGAAASAESGSS
jgi:type VI secretion system protein ImpA